MTTRKEALYKLDTRSPGLDVIPATVKFRHNRQQGLIEPLSAEEKMICALRKVLTAMSDIGRCRYYIAGNEIKLIERPVTTEGRKGEPQTYRASGRCRVRIAHPEGHVSSMMIQFTVSYRDTEDERGLADVEYIEPTTIDQIPKTTAIS